MRFRQLGRSGLSVSVIGLGCNNFGASSTSGVISKYGSLDLAQTREVVHAALDSGVTLFDTADVYGHGGSERFLGEILRSRRDEVVIATKWGSGLPTGTAWGSRRYVRQAVVASLRRLATDRIDLYQLHWPDPLTPIEETLAALDELVHEGKILYSGSSHFAGWQIVDADWTASSRRLERMVSAQNEYNLIERRAESDLIPACVHAGVGLLPYFPLASGLLTGKYRHDRPAPSGSRLEAADLAPETFTRIGALAAAASACGRTLLDLAIAGLASRPAVASVITGATSAGQIAANAQAADWELSPGELEILEQALA